MLILHYLGAFSEFPGVFLRHGNVFFKKKE
jgi:hypothetical protein